VAVRRAGLLWRGDEFHMASTSRLCPASSWRSPRGSNAHHRDPRQTPSSRELPVGLFLRNHDELTLEMVTDADRTTMYLEYARDPLMRSTRHRVVWALMDNGRRQIELLNSLLLSMPGSPIIYYGTRSAWVTTSTSEIAVCPHPMQWSSDRNAASHAQTPRALQSVSWIRSTTLSGQRGGAVPSPNLIAELDTRSRRPQALSVFGRGTFEALHPPTCAAGVTPTGRGSDDLVRRDLSRFVQPVSLDSLGYVVEPHRAHWRDPFPRSLRRHTFSASAPHVLLVSPRPPAEAGGQLSEPSRSRRRRQADRSLPG